MVVPDSVLYIGRNAFHDCKNFESITIGKGVVHMGVEEVLHDLSQDAIYKSAF